MLENDDLDKLIVYALGERLFSLLSSDPDAAACEILSIDESPKKVRCVAAAITLSGSGSVGLLSDDARSRLSDAVGTPVDNSLRDAFVGEKFDPGTPLGFFRVLCGDAAFARDAAALARDEYLRYVRANVMSPRLSGRSRAAAREALSRGDGASVDEAYLACSLMHRDLDADGVMLIPFYNGRMPVYVPYRVRDMHGRDSGGTRAR